LHILAIASETSADDTQRIWRLSIRCTNVISGEQTIQEWCTKEMAARLRKDRGFRCSYCSSYFYFDGFCMEMENFPSRFGDGIMLRYVSNLWKRSKADVFRRCNTLFRILASNKLPQPILWNALRYRMLPVSERFSSNSTENSNPKKSGIS
jgi:hypothetical protein